MKKIIKSLLGISILTSMLFAPFVGVKAQSAVVECNGIKLNTNFPIIGNCIPYKGDSINPTNVFPTMMGILTKIIISAILVVCFITIIIAGIMRAGAGEDSSQVTKAKKLLDRVAITVLLLGFSGVILKLINPNFFG